MGKNHSLKIFCQALRKYDRYLLSCHVHPEGDAVGSILAMDSLLRRLGKKTRVVCQDPFPDRLACLPSERWNQPDSLDKNPFDFQAVILADCPVLERLGGVKDFLKRNTVIFNIDHHISNTFYGDFNYVLPHGAATGEAVLNLFKYFRLPVSREEATDIYVAVATDTGSFRYGNTSIRSHRIAAQLIRTGINVDRINEALYSTYSLNKLNLYSRLFRRVKTAFNGQVAWLTVKREDLRRSGAHYEDTEGLIDVLKLIREVKIVFFVSELPGEEGVKVSFRSKGAYDVNKVAMSFNGGGHKKAAACVLNVSVRKAERMVLERLGKEIA